MPKGRFQGIIISLSKLDTITNDATMKIENYSEFFILKSFTSSFI